MTENSLEHSKCVYSTPGLREGNDFLEAPVTFQSDTDMLYSPGRVLTKFYLPVTMETCSSKTFRFPFLRILLPPFIHWIFFPLWQFLLDRFHVNATHHGAWAAKRFASKKNPAVWGKWTSGNEIDSLSHYTWYGGGYDQDTYTNTFWGKRERSFTLN